MRIAAGFFLLVGLSACIPGRENPRDPAIAPKAALALVDIGPGEVCPDDAAPLPIAPEYDTATDVSRGRCLALDGRISLDPQGQDDLKRWKFTLPPALGFEERTVVSSNGLLVLTKEYRSALPTDLPLVFRVKVTDRDGNYGKANVTVRLRNAQPIASIRSGASVTAGGLPWAPGTPFQVVLDGSTSHDPDGDDLRYCWYGPGLASEVCLPEDADDDGVPDGDRFTYPVPLAAGRYVVTLRIKDAASGEVEDGNSRVSRTAKANVWVEAPSLWEGDSANPLKLRRIDTSRFATIPSAQLLKTATPKLVTELDSPRRLRSYTFPGGVTDPADDFVYPVQPVADGSLFMDPARSRFWVVRSLDSNTRVETALFSIDESMGFDDLGSTSTDMVVGSRGSAMAVGADGSFWFAPFETPEIANVVDPALGANLLPIDATLIGFAGRPGTSEMWALVQGADTTAFRVYDSPTDDDPDSIALGQIAALGAQWIDGTEMWLSSIEFGLTRLDMTMLRQALDDNISPETSFLIATTAAIDVPGTSHFLLDLESEEIWSSQYRIAANFSEHYGAGIPSFIDPQGYGWTTSFNVMRRTRSFGPDGPFMEVVELPDGATNPSIDLSRGSIWLLRGNALEEITSEGDKGRRIPVIEIGGALQLLPDYDDLAVSADGTTAFASQYISGDSLIDEIDLRETPPTATRVLTYDDATDGKTIHTYGGFHPSVLAADRFLWTVEYDATEMYPVRVSGNGAARDTGVTISSQSGDSILISRSATDDAACIATMVSTYSGTGLNYTLAVRLYRALPGQPAVQLDFRQFAYVGGAGGGSNFLHPFVSATRSPSGGEMCWTGYIRRTNPATNEILTIFGAEQGSATIRSFTYTGLTGETIRSPVAVSPDEIYYVRDDTLYRRHSPNGSGVLSSEETLATTLSEGFGSILVTAETQSVY